MRKIIVTTDFRDIVSAYPVDSDNNPFKDYGLAARAYPMIDNGKDMDDNTIWTRYPEGNADHFYSAAIVECKEVKTWPVNCSVYDYTTEGLAQAKTDHPRIKWNMLGVIAGDTHPE